MRGSLLNRRGSYTHQSSESRPSTFASACSSPPGSNRLRAPGPQLTPSISNALGPAKTRDDSAHQTHALQSYEVSLGEGPEELACMLKGRYIIPAEEVNELLIQTGLSIDELLFALIKPASKLACNPISNFCVGAVGIGGSGAVYVGANLEFPRAPLNNSVHAEQFLLVNCLQHGEHELVALAVSAAPCGHCRQFYSEINKAESIRFMFGSDSRPKFLDDLLPEKFGPSDLIQGDPFPLLLQQQDNKIMYRSSSRSMIANRVASSADASAGKLFERAALEALDEAKQCYSPYSRCPSGVALVTHSGEVHSGGYVESAAYNPSLSPFHAAVIAGFVSGMRSFDEIKEVVLAELYSPSHQRTVHRDNIRLLMKSVAPKAKLTTLNLDWEK